MRELMRELMRENYSGFKVVSHSAPMLRSHTGVTF